MINVSNSFKEELNNDNRDYMCYVDIVLANPGDVVESHLQDSSGEYILDSSGENINTFFDGVVISLTNENLWSNALSIEESVSNQNSFDVGSVIINKATIVINNIYEDYTSYDFTGAKVTIRIGLQLSNGTIEVVNKGIFYVDSATYNGSLITLECLDSMSKFDKDYSESELIYPATLRQIVQDACSVCGVLYSASIFENDTFIVNERPSDESLTFRQMLNYVGQIACQQFSIDHNDRLIARWYDRDMMDDLYSSPSSVDDSEYHQISSINSQNINQDDVIITGVKVTEFSEDTENPGGSYLSGTTGYVIEIKDNKLIPIGKGSGVSTYLGQKLVGMRFRPMELTFQNDPTIEPTDIAEVIDFKGNHFYTFITSTNFTVGNTQTLSCGAESPIRNSASRYSAATQAYTNSKKLVEKEKTERELAVEALNNALSNASGMYTTEERQSDGSVITYLHDKPTLEESQNVIMITAEAIGISNDGGETYPYGLFLTGDLIARLLYVVGINADYINSGAITVADNDGEITFFADTETGRVDIKAYSLTITGKTVEEIAGEESEAVLNDFVDAVYTPTITNLQNQVDGQIETYYEDYEPSLQNYPANEWTTTEERQKHEGDLFFWKSKGYAYRFFQDGATWKWQMVQDTDITSALVAAEKAQDTADGKRRVFVTTPQPPYDIGDLWTNGEDILTCSTARSAGSAYVSTDWKKLNTYTDDTVANEALEEARKARNLNIILDNEYQGIYADSNGNIGTFPTVQTTVQVLYGHTDVSVDCTYSIAKSSGVTGSWSNAARMYTVTGLSTDSGWVDITASYLNLFTATKRFNVEKIKGGTNGKDGETGKGIKSVTNHYLATNASSGVTTGTSGWTTTIQTITASKKYLWNYETITYTDNSTTNTTPCIIGTYGEKGANGDDGNGIASITEHYAVSSSNTTAPASWSTTVPTMTKTNKYLWNYETIKYTNGNSVNTTKRVIGVYGDTGPAGTNGKGIKSVTNHYLATNASSGVTTGTSGWTTTIQTITASKKYLWNYETITYTDNSTTNTTPCIIGTYGEKGANGDDGNGIASITEHYAVSSSNTTAPASWSSTVPAMTKANRYLWNYETIKYTNGTSVNTAKRVIGVYGDTGQNGTPGRTYMIEPSVNILKRSKDDTISPNFVEFKSYYRDGNSATRTAYSGRWIIEETSDGDEWTTIYTSSANESSVKHYLYSMLADSDGSAIANANGDTIGIPRDIVAIRAKLYAAGGTTNLLDTQSVAVVIDVDNLTHEEIFNLLTNNGAIQGIYQEGNQIYINAEYIQTGTMSADRIYGGTLSLGGANNSGGVFNLYDENGTLKSVMDNDGFNFWDGENFVGSIRTRYMEEYERGCCAICADNVSVIALSSNYIFDNDPDSKVFNSDIYITNTGFFVGDQYKLPGVHFPRYVYFENDIQIGQHGRISEDALTSNRLLDISVSPGDDIWIGAYSNEFGDTEVRIYGDLQQMRDPSNPSDERLKTKITPFSESAINIINDIQIYGYTWIESGKSEKAGFIAQQLESDVSADLTRIGKDGVHNVKPTKMIPYLVKAVQELSEEIELLKKEICDLKGENYTPKEHKKDKWKPSDMSLEEKREFIESLKRAERKK